MVQAEGVCCYDTTRRDARQTKRPLLKAFFNSSFNFYKCNSISQFKRPQFSYQISLILTVCTVRHIPFIPILVRSKQKYPKLFSTVYTMLYFWVCMRPDMGSKENLKNAIIWQNLFPNTGQGNFSCQPSTQNCING